MTRTTRTSAAVVLAFIGGVAACPPAHAGLFFNRTAKPAPAERVPALVTTLKSDPAERKRADAAGELGDLDLVPFPEAVDALTQALLTDPSAGVRGQALRAVGRLKTPPAQVVAAVERCKTADTSTRLRAHAQRLWLSYQLHGYTPKPESKPGSPPPATAVAVPAPQPTPPAVAQAPAAAEPAPVLKSVGPQPTASRTSRLWPWSAAKPASSPPVASKETAAPPLAAPLAGPPAANLPPAAGGTLEPAEANPPTLSPVPGAASAPSPGPPAAPETAPENGPELVAPK